MSHGAISAKFAAVALAKRTERDRLWRHTHDQGAVVDALLAIGTELLDALNALDPDHRPAQEWLARAESADPVGGGPHPR